MIEMSSVQESLKVRLNQLECHFTWDIKTDDLDFENLLSRLEEQDKLDLGKEEGVARAQCSLGFVKFLFGHKEEALTHTMRSEKLIKENLGENCDNTLIVTYGNFAWINYHLKKYTECDSYLEKLQKISEKIPTEFSSVPEVLGEKGWAYLKFSRKYYDRAAEAFKKAVELDPENSEWNTGYAIALYRIESGTESWTVDSPAIKQLRKAIDINPEDDVLRVLLGLKLQTCSKVLMNESEKLVETALNGSPEHPHVMRYVGMFLRDKGSVDWSIALLKKGLERSPNSCFIHHQLAMCYRTKKIALQKEKGVKAEVDDARNQSIYHLEIATKLKPSFIFAMNDLALLYGERRELSKAEELFDKIFKTAKDRNEHLQSVHFYYAQFHFYSSRCEDLAIQHYKECLTLGPQTTFGDRSAQKLMVIAKKHMRVNPDDSKANEIVTFIYEKKGEMFESYANTSGNENEFLANILESMSL